jgi:hypothetical protein
VTGNHTSALLLSDSVAVVTPGAEIAVGTDELRAGVEANVQTLRVDALAGRCAGPD